MLLGLRGDGSTAAGRLATCLNLAAWFERRSRVGSFGPKLQASGLSSRSGSLGELVRSLTRGCLSCSLGVAFSVGAACYGNACGDCCKNVGLVQKGKSDEWIFASWGRCGQGEDVDWSGLNDELLRQGRGGNKTTTVEVLKGSRTSLQGSSLSRKSNR
jgi:hypothetical protein